MSIDSGERSALPESVQSYIERLEAKSQLLSQRVQALEVELATARTHHARAHNGCQHTHGTANVSVLRLQQGLPRRSRGHVW